MRQRKGKRDRQIERSVKSIVTANLSNPIRPLFKRVTEKVMNRGMSGPRFYDPVYVGTPKKCDLTDKELYDWSKLG